MQSIIWWTKRANIQDRKKIQIERRRRKREVLISTLDKEKDSRWSIKCNLRETLQTAKVKVKNESSSARIKLSNNKKAVALIDILEESPIIVKAHKTNKIGRAMIKWGQQKGENRTMKAIRLLVPMTKHLHTQMTRRKAVALPKVTYTSMTSTIRIKQISRKAFKIMVSTDSANLYQALVLGTAAMESR